MVNLKIDGKAVQIEKGATILAAAEKIGVTIPTLCFLKKVSPTGACRICVVDIAGVDKPMTACNTVAVEGMAVTTQSERLAKIRRQVVELLLVNHPLDCPVCDAGGECDLQNVCYAQDVTSQPFGAEDVNPGVIDRWPLIQQVPNRCILCEKCVKVCHEVVGSSALFVNDKGDRAFIDKHLDLCEFCGNCVQVCPTGTMISKPFKFRARPWELRKVASVCTACGSHCQVDLNVKQDEVYRVTSEDGVTRNDGNLCIGGFFGTDYLRSPARLTSPLVKQGESQQPASWDTALALIVERLQSLGAAKGEAVAGLASPRLTNEENYLFQKLFRVLLGSNNIDSEARFGALRSNGVLRQALGLSGASNRIDRIGAAEAVLVFGCDVTAEAPAIDWQIEQACRKRDGKLVLAGQRGVKLDRHAHTVLRYRPGSEAALATALARMILDAGLADKAYLQQYVGNGDELLTGLQGVDLAATVAATGLAPELIDEAARYLGAARSVALIFGADISKGPEAEAATAALANLALVCGALHGEIGGLFPVDEKGNMQGLLDMGVCPENLPGQQAFATSKAAFEQVWGATLPTAGRDALAILEGIEKGEVRFLYLAATNPLVSFPEAGRWRKALAKVEFLVVQDILASELTALADVVLPAAGFAEKNGTVTSLDQRINRLVRATGAPGAAREDFAILAELYQRLAGTSQIPQLDQVASEITALVPSYADTCFPTKDARSGLKAPFAPAPGSLRFTPVVLTAPNATGPQLVTGKVLFHFGTTTTFANGCLAVAPSGYVAMSPRDAEALGVKDGGRVKLTSGSGSLLAPVKLSAQLPDGLLFAPCHFADTPVQQLLTAAGNRVSVQVAKA
ncbi:NADPH oxidoreductase subunit alpha [Desulfuromonas sp. DDH964]|uniref:molybdopterin-dependent oxidoreductase n=1 Tax=Desulfuromonas sp. DDH964 TaxID=1823759 RepID=UPI00078CFEFF|nr:molybdopterin-dependent oxidoreductase [Desulfuromonas sp. DDH964]AMV71058.1 NADPH oxidoreductase subunit alpha [Desulfuromonas sp. DDH964]